MDQIVETYLKLGTTGANCVLLGWIVIYIFKNLIPKINNVETQITTMKEILNNVSNIMKDNQETIKDNQNVMISSQKAIENNTEAMKNFSQTLHEFATLITVQNERLKDIDDSVNQTSNQIIRLSERIK